MPAPNTAEMTLTAEVVIAIGTVTNNKRFFYFEGLYREFVARDGDDRTVVKAFIQALSFRRCKSIELLRSLLTQLLRSPLLDDEDLEDLMNIAADLGDRQLVVEVLSRGAGSLQRAGFYCHAMRAVTQRLHPPDLRLAMQLVDEIGNVGALWVETTLAYFISGCARTLRRVPYDAIFRVLEIYLEHQRQQRSLERMMDDDPSSGYTELLEGGTINQIVAACERALDDDVPRAKRLLDLIPEADRWSAVKLVVPSFREFMKPELSQRCVFICVDPLSIDLVKLEDFALTLEGSPSQCYFFILYSHVRVLCEQAALVPDDHVVMTTKVLPLRRLVDRHPKIVNIVPPHIQLHMRDVGITFDNSCNFTRSDGTGLTHEGEEQLGGVPALPCDGGVAAFVTHMLWVQRRFPPEENRATPVLTANPRIIAGLQPLLATLPKWWFSLFPSVEALSKWEFL